MDCLQEHSRHHTGDDFEGLILSSIDELRKAFRNSLADDSSKERKAIRVSAFANLVSWKEKNWRKARLSLPIRITVRTSQQYTGTSISLVTQSGSQASGLSNKVETLAVATLTQAGIIPQFKSWSYLRKNELALEVGRKMFYTDSTGETIPASDSEDEAKGDTNLEGIYYEQEAFVVAKAIEKFGCVSSTIKALSEQLKCNSAVIEGLMSERRRTASHSNKECQAEPLQSLCKVFCRRCQGYYCRVHQGEQVKPLRTMPSHTQCQTAGPCGNACFKHDVQAMADRDQCSFLSKCETAPHKEIIVLSDSSSDNAGISSQACNLPQDKSVPSQQKRLRSEWTAHEQYLLGKGQQLYGRIPCKIARLVGTRSCSEVAAYTEPPFWTAHPGTASRDLSRIHGVSKHRWNSQQRKQSKIAIKRSQHKGLLWEEYEPCSCKEGCDLHCPCLANAQYCEKYCSCGPDCIHSFPGCACSGGCRTKTCPCSAAGFECDPDICKNCECAALGTEPAQGIELCKNMALRLQQHKRVAVGMSSIAGWGAFLLEPAKRNDLIGEYTGELINQQEAERRGKVYDRDDNSYLFNLDRSWVVDARLQGNKLRFANHSTEPNCIARILTIDGDHRVAIYAIKDMVTGEELFYNYSYAAEGAPAWAKRA